MEQISGHCVISISKSARRCLGIVGRNGGGKSTLLKILSRITHPSEGKVELFGRVGSLLEVGTGFHPELTGRENIFLNGAILGMKRAEIAKKFDEIVDFSGVESFLILPSSATPAECTSAWPLRSRLILSPRFCLLTKCWLSVISNFKTNAWARWARLLAAAVPSCLSAIICWRSKSICKSAIFLEAGGSEWRARPINVVSEYTKSVTSAGAMFADLSEHPGRRLEATPLINEVSVISKGEEPSVIRMGDGVDLTVEFESPFLFVRVSDLLSRPIAERVSSILATAIRTSYRAKLPSPPVTLLAVDSLPSAAGTLSGGLMAG